MTCLPRARLKCLDLTKDGFSQRRTPFLLSDISTHSLQRNGFDQIEVGFIALNGPIFAYSALLAAIFCAAFGLALAASNDLLIDALETLFQAGKKRRQN